ncbi:MAG: DUF488 domain-containing protein [Saprospiraceae bacterium]|nr:DUF488 domain-containing protein [Saprospiraceae bacterium]
MEKFVFTVGHSNHEPDYFVALLRAHDVNCVVDVRSVAASARNPGFNKKTLEAYLQQHTIRYLHFDEGFGARQENPALHDEHGQVDFEKVQRTTAFLEAVRRLELGLEKGFRIALMCSEANPLDCHRFSMISVYLRKQGFSVRHILKDASLADHAELESGLLEKYQKKLPTPSLFEPDIGEEDRLRYAYHLHNRDIGWSVKTQEEVALDD